MAEHTPGPWKVDISKHFKDMAYVRMSNDTEVCATAADDAYVVVPLKVSDAHLIAAAPDLLEALKDLVERCDGEEGVRGDRSNIQTLKAHAALDKAEGKS